MRFGQFPRCRDRGLKMLFRTRPLLLLKGLDSFVIVTRRYGIRASGGGQGHALRRGLASISYDDPCQYYD